jgi:hypothetical protein
MSECTSQTPRPPGFAPARKCVLCGLCFRAFDAGNGVRDSVVWRSQDSTHGCAQPISLLLHILVVMSNRHGSADRLGGLETEGSADMKGCVSSEVCSFGLVEQRQLIAEGNSL